MPVFSLLVLAAASAAPRPADPRDRAYQAKTVTEALGLLGVQTPDPGPKLLLTAPDIVEGSPSRAAKVKIQLRSDMPGTDWMAILVERGSQPLLVYQDFTPGAAQILDASTELTATTHVRAVVRVAGKYYQVSREIKLASPGWTQGHRP